MTAGALMAAEMAEQPRILQQLIDAREDVHARVRAILPPAPVRVVVVARGSSDHAAIYGRYVLEHATRTPVALAAPSLITRYGVPTDYRGWVAVAASQSGSTPEVVSTLARMQAQGAMTVALTNEADSPLARAADLALLLGAGEERAVPATKTFTAQVLLFALLAEAIGPVPWVRAEWRMIAPAVESLLADPEPAADVAAAIDAATGLVVLARGMLLSAALEAALKVAETTSILAQGMSVADFRHGPIAVVRPELPVLAMSVAGPCAQDVSEAVTDIRARGGRVFTISDGADADLSLLSRMPEAFAPITTTIRAQQLALALARHRGLDPDAPRGLTKITATV